MRWGPNAAVIFVISVATACYETPDSMGGPCLEDAVCGAGGVCLVVEAGAVGTCVPVEGIAETGGGSTEDGGSSEASTGSSADGAGGTDLDTGDAESDGDETTGVDCPPYGDPNSGQGCCPGEATAPHPAQPGRTWCAIPCDLEGPGAQCPVSAIGLPACVPVLDSLSVIVDGACGISCQLSEADGDCPTGMDCLETQFNSEWGVCVW